MPKISVLMPVYKTKEGYLLEAIQSILEQTFTDFEFLILDDAPDDDRESVVRSFADPRIIYHQNDCNLGITPSRNKLIRMARGEYLAVMDHDDVSLPERFAKQAAYLDAHPETGVVGTWVDTFPKKVELHFPEDDLDIKTLLTDVCPLVHPSAMIRKSVLADNALGYEETFSPAEDYRLWCRLMEHTRFYNIPEVLFKYRTHDSNTSLRQKQKMQQATRRIQNDVRAQYPQLFKNCLYQSTYRRSVRLFGFIPLLDIESYKNKTIVRLFGMFPIFSLKEKRCAFPVK